MVHRIFVIGNARASVIGKQHHYGYNAGASSTGRKTMTTPKANFASLALIAALCGGSTLGLTALAGLGLFGRRGCEAWREIGRREAGL